MVRHLFFNMEAQMSHLNQYHPDYCVSPGDILKERLEAQGYTVESFAHKIGLTTEMLESIIAGREPISSATALVCKHLLGMDVSVWLGVQSNSTRFLLGRATSN